MHVNNYIRIRRGIQHFQEPLNNTSEPTLLKYLFTLIIPPLDVTPFK